MLSSRSRLYKLDPSRPGRVFKLGSWEAGGKLDKAENLGSWKPGKLGCWELGKLQILEARKLGNYKFGKLEILKAGKLNNSNRLGHDANRGLESCARGNKTKSKRY